jgi:hypothetical protein
MSAAHVDVEKVSSDNSVSSDTSVSSSSMGSMSSEDPIEPEPVTCTPAPSAQFPLFAALEIFSGLVNDVFTVIAVGLNEISFLSQNSVSLGLMPLP